MRIIALAATGYGEIEDGQPSWEQREMLVYTNFVRVDPTHWQSEYDCNLNTFSSSEKQAIDPALYHSGLTEIAQLHTEEMNQYDFLAHESRDGTSFGDRVWPYYEGTTIGENVAMGYENNWDAVFVGWMCSAGHRSNIMEPDFEDIGTGVDGRYYTQDFGGGAGQSHQNVAMGIHSPYRPSGSVEFLATWHDSNGPGELWVETENDCIAMDIEAGTDNRGAWSIGADAGSGCQAYRFVWSEGSDYDSLPSTGAYQYGNGCAEWISSAPETCIPSSGDDDGGSGEGGDHESDDEDDSGNSAGDGESTDTDSDDCPEIDRNGDCLPDDVISDESSGMGCVITTTKIHHGMWLFLVPLFVSRRRI